MLDLDISALHQNTYIVEYLVQAGNKARWLIKAQVTDLKQGSL